MKPTDPTTAELVKPILDKFEGMLTELEDVARKDDDHWAWGEWCGADWTLNHATRDELVTLHSWAELQTEFSRESICDVVDVGVFWFTWDDADFARGFVEGSLLMWEPIRVEIYRLASQVEQQQAKIVDRGPLTLAERIRLCTAWTKAKEAAQLAIAAAKRAHDAWMNAEGGRQR